MVRLLLVSGDKERLPEKLINRGDSTGKCVLAALRCISLWILLMAF